MKVTPKVTPSETHTKILIAKSADPKWKPFLLIKATGYTEWFRSHSAAMRRACELLGNDNIHTRMFRRPDGTTEVSLLPSREDQ